jgi:transcriptional repressor NrdR
MRCPYCRQPESKVIDSRETEDSVRRRRECLSCQQRYTTYERVEASNLLVAKRDGRRETYNRTKLLEGVRKACTKRPIPTEDIERVVNDIESDLFSLSRAEVSSVVVGEKVMNALRDLDEVAYVRFASVYRQFTDLDGLSEEISEFKEWQRRRAEAKDQLSFPL